MSRASLLKLFAITIFLIGGCASPRASFIPIGTVTSRSAAYSFSAAMHTMLPGETMWSIGQRYHVPYRAIMSANGIANAAKIPAGMVLTIPQPKLPKAIVPVYVTSRWTHIVVHHSAMPEGNAKIIDKSHRKKGFKNGFGYQFVIDNGTANRASGQIEIGSRWKRQIDGAHCNANGMNQHGIGICLIGDFTKRKPSESQMRSLVALVNQLRSYYRIPPSRIISHGDVPGKNTACPGDSFPWAEFKARLASSVRY